MRTDIVETHETGDVLMKITITLTLDLPEDMVTLPQVASLPRRHVS